MDDDQQIDDQYELTLSGEGVTIRRSVTSDVAAAIINMIMGGRAAAPMAAAHHRPAPASPPTVPEQYQYEQVDELSPGEYIDETEAKRNPDKIVALAHWLKIHRDQDTFERDEIRRLFEQAGESLPKNFSRDLRWAQQVRWIQPSMEDANRYRLTKKGTSAVEQRFSSEVIKATKQPASRRNRSSNGQNGDEA